MNHIINCLGVGIMYTWVIITLATFVGVLIHLGWVSIKTLNKDE